MLERMICEKSRWKFRGWVRTARCENCISRSTKTGSEDGCGCYPLWMISVVFVSTHCTFEDPRESVFQHMVYLYMDVLTIKNSGALSLDWENPAAGFLTFGWLSDYLGSGPGGGGRTIRWTLHGCVDGGWGWRVIYVGACTPDVDACNRSHALWCHSYKLSNACWFEGGHICQLPLKWSQPLQYLTLPPPKFLICAITGLSNNGLSNSLHKWGVVGM